MAGLDPAICRLHGLSTIVIPANAGIQLHFAQHRWAGPRPPPGWRV